MATALLLGLALLQTPDAVIEGPMVPVRQGLFMIELTIDGRPAKLLFDTGAFGSILTPEAYGRVTGKAYKERGTGVFNQTAPEHDYRIGGKSIGRGKPFGGDLHIFKESTLGLKYDGVLGRDLIGQRLWILDYLRGTFKVLPAATSREDLALHVKGIGEPKSYKALDKDYYCIPMFGTGWWKRGLIDTGTTQHHLTRTIWNLIDRHWIGKSSVSYAEAREQTDIALASGILFGGLPTVYPFALMEPTRLDGIEGVLSPYELNVRAMAFFPNRDVAIWPTANLDLVRSKALKRITGLSVTVREGKILITTGLAPDEGVDREVVSIAGRPSAKILELLDQRDASAFHEVETLAMITLERCEVKIARPEGMAKVELKTKPVGQR